MKYMKYLKALCLFALIMVVLSPATAQSGRFEIFEDQIPDGAQWIEKDYSRRGGHGRESVNYIYVGSQENAGITGLSLPIRANPGPGEYRYITFAWIKWGGDQIAMQFHHDSTARFSVQSERRYNFTYFAGEVHDLTGFRISNRSPGRWTIVTRDLWNDFGDFTLTGVSFICPMRRDAGFDNIILGRTEADLGDVPQIIPTQVARPVDVEDADFDFDEMFRIDFEEEEAHGVQIDWASQIRAGGIWMYPLYLLAFIAVIVVLLRTMTVRAGRLAPKKLRKAIRENIASGNIDAIDEACKKNYSTLAEALSFIFKYRSSGREAVSQTAGDMAARDIRTHLSGIYPLSVIASVAPLLGLLGTIVGMIEAFGLVALYGDEGGAAILSDSISKALITTAAGLIIAAPTVYIYFVIKNKIMRYATVIEVEIEKVITAIYLTDGKEKTEIEENPETEKKDNKNETIAE